MQHNADLIAQRVELHAADVMAVHGDASSGRVIETWDQVDDGRLAGAGRPKQGDHLAGLRSKRDIVQHLVASKVAERDMLETDLAVNRRQRRGVGGIAHLGLGVEDGENPFSAGGRGHQGWQDHAQAAHGLDQQPHVGGKSDHLAQRQAPVHYQRAAIPDDEDGSQVCDQIEEGHVEGLLAGGPGRKLKPAIVFDIETGHFGRFLCERLHDTGAAQILLQVRGQHGQLLLNGQGQRPKAAAKACGPVGQQRHRPQSQKCQVRVHESLKDHRAQEQDQAFGQAQERAPGHEANPIHILDGAREELAHLSAVVIGERKRRQLPIQCIAQIVGHPLRGNLSPTAGQKGQDAPDDHQAEKRKDRAAQYIQLAAANPAVNRAADELGRQQGQGAGDEESQVSGACQARVRAQIAKAAQQDAQGARR